ncbi:MAG: hypothetical protein KDC90_07955 [Ignavibacteriae bacterium]|nr:hypothetical protein [Ignavibacteriota bacterium]
MKNITEKDLYKYVFYPRELSQDKFDYISDNKAKFEDELNFLSILQSQIDTEIPENILEKINNKISGLNANTDIILKKENNKLNGTSTEFHLAAASPTSPTVEKTQTFRDEKSQYLAKVIYGDDENRLFLFAKNPDVNNNICVKILPSENEYYANLKELPINISKEKLVEQLILKLNC